MYDEKEPLMSVTKFNKPKILEGSNAALVRIVRLILLEPGTIQTHPNMGVGIVSFFRNKVDKDITELNSRIESQINTFLPMYTSVTVNCILDNDEKCVRIFIKSNELNTYIPINTETGSVLENML